MDEEEYTGPKYLTEEDIRFIQEANADYERLREDPEALAHYQERRVQWARFVAATWPRDGDSDDSDEQSAGDSLTS